MVDIESIIKKAYKNNKTIHMSEILSLDLETTLYNELMRQLKENKIIVDEEIEKEEQSEFSYLTSDITRQYLKEVGKIPLLTKEEEKALFEEYSATKSEKLKEKIVSANLRLVVDVVKKFGNRIKISTTDFIDSIQDGNEGLLKAVEKYDVNLGYKFSTYAIWWIKQGISRGLDDTGRSIRIPVHAMEDYNKIKKCIQNIVQKTGMEPSAEVISKLTGIKQEKIDFLIKKVEDRTMSLSEVIGNFGETVVEELIKSEDKSVEDTVIDEIMTEEIQNIMSKSLKEKEFFVICHRMGIVNEINSSRYPKTLEEVGQLMGLTRERIRQIEYRALKKMRTKILKEENMNSHSRPREKVMSVKKI